MKGFSVGLEAGNRSASPRSLGAMLRGSHDSTVDIIFVVTNRIIIVGQS